MTHVKGKGPIYMVGLSGGRKGGAPPAAAPFRTKNLPPLPARSDDMVTEKVPPFLLQRSCSRPFPRMLLLLLMYPMTERKAAKVRRRVPVQERVWKKARVTAQAKRAVLVPVDLPLIRTPSSPMYHRRFFPEAPPTIRGHAQLRRRRTRHCPDGGRKRWRCRSGIGHQSSGYGVMDKAALSAAYTYAFAPAYKEGYAVRCYASKTFVFALH